MCTFAICAFCKHYSHISTIKGIYALFISLQQFPLLHTCTPNSLRIHLVCKTIMAALCDLFRVNLKFGCVLCFV